MDHEFHLRIKHATSNFFLILHVRKKLYLFYQIVLRLYTFALDSLCGFYSLSSFILRSALFYLSISYIFYILMIKFYIIRFG